jgi:hypothetical protein
MDRNTITIIALSAIIGGLAGYMYRDHQLFEQEAAVRAVMAGPPHALALAPPGSVPPMPGLDGKGSWGKR